MGNKTATRTRSATVRLTPALENAANLVGNVTGRTRSALMEHALELYIRKNYPAAFVPGAKVELSLAEAPEDLNGNP